eukprot:TRINITY_DN1442_c0_g1_i3.p1 TRINITY_DN1442_c0_g1~~TRINITY_DN1442_c0_g1_i3.p1  ORF type:complete len:1066 (+),score=331.44 TRINITY_DN1442_c0_g1_i3:1132-4329(+)
MLAQEQEPDSDEEKPMLDTVSVAGKKRISELRSRVKSARIQPYLDRFDEVMKPETLLVGSISVEEAERQEQEMEQQRIAAAIEKAREDKLRQEDLEQRERLARHRILTEQEAARIEARRRQRQRAAREQIQADQIKKVFQKAEAKLKNKLTQRQAEIQTKYGELRSSAQEYGGFKGRKWLVDWEHTPQPVMIRLDTARAIKDKVPKGRYVLVVSLYDRLGGNELRWSNLHKQSYDGSTVPVRHSGAFHAQEIKFNQNVFIVCPAKIDMHPSMTFYFELYLLKGRSSPIDRVVAWGAFPAYDNRGDVVRGKFKTPMLRGPTDLSVYKYERIDSLISKDVENWMANIYFKVEHLSRFADNRREYEVELQFTTELLGNPDRFDESEEESDGLGEDEEDEDEEVEGVHKLIKGSTLRKKKKTKAEKAEEKKKLLGELEESDEDADDEDGSDAEEGKGKGKRRKGKGRAGVDIDSESDDEDAATPRLAPRPGRRAGALGKKAALPPTPGAAARLTGGSSLRTGLPPPPGRKRAASTSATAYTSNADGTPDSEDSATPRKRYVPRSERKAQGHVVDRPDHRAQSGGEGDDASDDEGVRTRMTRADRMAQYQMSVSKRLHNVNEAFLKMQYIYRDLTADIGLKQWRTVEFWVMMFLFILAFWFRMYMHYFGQRLYLLLFQVPVSNFTVRFHTCQLDYPTEVTLGFEVGMTVVGVATNIIIFMGLMACAFISQRVLGHFADTFSRFMLAYGVATTFDWLALIIIDCIIQNWRGDAFKLYNQFVVNEGNGVAGIFMTTFINLSLFIFCIFLMYNYMLRLHMNGRIFDVFARLNGDEELFMVPYDLEMSVRELKWVCIKAERWRGKSGERRKVGVVQIDLTDESDPSFRETTVHIGVFTWRLDNSHELYRHFMKMANGAIVEVFGGVDGIKDESRLWLGHDVQEESGTLADFLAGRLGDLANNVRNRVRHMRQLSGASSSKGRAGSSREGRLGRSPLSHGPSTVSASASASDDEDANEETGLLALPPAPRRHRKEERGAVAPLHPIKDSDDEDEDDDAGAGGHKQLRPPPKLRAK